MATVEDGAIPWIHWQSGAAQLLPRLIAGRSEGPLFLTEIFEESSRLQLLPWAP
ncbi:hypothetical protein [Streptomyces sp. HNM1019]|uniref:hypothetical protein n=1 Tax=Streptomyces sp. HNM1019 TaxID=3424717 RepID=UPI003D76E02F